ncbi:hypothetical protein MKW94_006444 [Papaver nudicaule]|uniref:CCHC-type domain-containing protein n=1 Tax=Papaver nudicaule TaxID=74823 RepID=A0AA41S7P8_PAPNU|nr:hypothetical protein [Papaver nudicaule]
MDRLQKEERISEKKKMNRGPCRSSLRKRLKRAYKRSVLDAQLRANTAHDDTDHGKTECVAVNLENNANVPIIEEFEIGNLQHDPSSDRISTSISQENLEELMTCIKKDPYLKPIIEDIEIGGPAIMMRYLNDPEILHKLGQAMGFGVSGEIVDATEHNPPADYAEDKTARENDSIVFDGNEGIHGHKDVINGEDVIPAWVEAITEPKTITFYRFCYNCRERGHKASGCPKKKVQVGNKS